ncbi:MAG: carboxypeptidase-like regulatory domain-containing protein [Phycisphaerae bacterium]
MNKKSCVLAAGWVALIALLTAGGCAEVLSDGHISDRETGGTIANVEIEALTPGGRWKPVDTTDRRGYFWILKMWVPSGSTIRLSRPGYFPREMSESEFLRSKSHLMTPTGAAFDPNDLTNDPLVRELMGDDSTP